MENKLEFYTSKGRITKLILSSSIITIIGISCINSDLLIIDIIGFLNLILGLLGISLGLYNLLDNSPQLILTDIGIEHKKITKKMISWNDISKAEIKKERNNHMIVLKQKGNINFDKFKYLFKKTAKSQLKNNIIKLNIEQLVVDYPKLNAFLNSKLNKKKADNLS
ncbi:hypothetical protein HSX10_12560 [Winogradskyella undariae]|uniref:STM3941 family protein n=1 Tax=Winogradskyella undariae TaxID=1285465 RepID=UPI00156ACF1C|nr:STM3941 family protein [Winogradskyella undariae]NRR92401.1 hypothetical protein [Winogradskyella undariae]